MSISARAWPEDFSDENGNYTCTCCECKQLFIGYKRRVTCKVCATKEQPQGCAMTTPPMETIWPSYPNREDAMTTPTPRTDATDYFDMIVHARQLERDLAAAREELVRERMAQTNVEMAHAQEKNELRQQLAAAQEAIRISKDTIDCLNGAVEREQEARERAEERLANERAVVEKLREDYERAGAKPRFMALMKLIRETQDANVRAQRAEERVRELENFADLMADEFQRIVVCCESGDTFVASEIIGLCQRAVKTTKQNVPVIVQRDRAEALAESLKADAERLDWLHARAFTIYRTRDPESKALSIHVTIVDEDAKGPRTGITAPTIRAAIDSAMATRV